jgi:hypothetical protein
MFEDDHFEFVTFGDQSSLVRQERPGLSRRGQAGVGITASATYRAGRNKRKKIIELAEIKSKDHAYVSNLRTFGIICCEKERRSCLRRAGRMKIHGKKTASMRLAGMTGKTAPEACLEATIC